MRGREKASGRLQRAPEAPGRAGCLLAWPTRSASSSCAHLCLSHPAGQCSLLRPSGGSGLVGVPQRPAPCTLLPALTVPACCTHTPTPACWSSVLEGPGRVLPEKVRPHDPPPSCPRAARLPPALPLPLGIPQGSLSTLTVTLGTGVTSRDGDRSRTTTTTSHRGQTLTTSALPCMTLASELSGSSGGKAQKGVGL